MKFPNDKHQGPNKDQEDKQQIPNKTDRSLLGQSTIGDLELKPRDSNPWVGTATPAIGRPN
jgi:hypothetical protein